MNSQDGAGYGKGSHAGNAGAAGQGSLRPRTSPSGVVPIQSRRALSDLRLLIVANDMGAAEELAAALSSCGARVAIAPPLVDAIDGTRALDPEVVLLDPETLGPALPAVTRALSNDDHLRWAAVLQWRWERLWTHGECSTVLSSLEALAVPLVKQERALREQLTSSLPIHTQLELIGPGRVLRSVFDSGRPWRIIARTPRARIDLEIVDGRVDTAVWRDRRSADGDLSGSAATAAFLTLRKGRLEIEACRRPTSADATVRRSVSTDIVEASRVEAGRPILPPKIQLTPESERAFDVLVARRAGKVLEPPRRSSIPAMLSSMSALSKAVQAAPSVRPMGATRRWTYGAAVLAAAVALVFIGIQIGSTKVPEPVPVAVGGEPQSWTSAPERPSVGAGIAPPDTAVGPGVSRSVASTTPELDFESGDAERLQAHPVPPPDPAHAIFARRDEQGTALDAAGRRRMARTLVDRARALSVPDQAIQAEMTYREALVYEPDNARAMAGLADVFLRSGEPEQAILWAERAVQRAPRRASYRILAGDAYEAAGEMDRARESWHEALEITPDSPRARRRLGL